jgi:lipopolysaccharide biosynthesis regulator YciM
MGFVVTLIVVAVAAVVVVAVVGDARRKRTRAEEETPYQRGLNALISGDRDAAFRHLAQAVRDDSRNLDAYIKLGNLLRERGQIRQAAQVHRELLVKRRLPKPLRSEIVRNLALDLAQAGRWAEVIEQLQSLPRAERADRPVLALSRDAYEAVGDYDRALAVHREILKGEKGGAGRQPSVGIYRAHTGLLALERGDKAGARADLAAALKEDPAAFLANLYLGDIAAADGDLERAVAYWMKLVTDRPDCAHLAFDRLEKAYFDLGDYGRMLRVYEDIVARAPSSVHAYCGLARMLERKGDIDEAVRAAREAIKHEGDSLVGHRTLVEILARHGRFEEATGAAQEVLSRPEGESGAGRCRACGEPLSAPSWRCQSCRAWLDAC